MISIAIKFHAGRFHATPWGRHVNESAVEWPPAPWRILRALVACWKRTAPELGQECVLPVLKKLAGPPEFVLPPATIAHTRHFMPLGKNKKGEVERTLVFDTFVVVPKDAELVVRWPDQELDPAEQRLLSAILANLNTLGRAESWCDARLIEAGAAPKHGAKDTFVSRPLGPEAQPGPDEELVWLLCADPETAFDPAILTSVVVSGRGGRASNTLAQKYDPAWPLCIETGDIHHLRWSDPPGSRWVRYARPLQCFQTPRMRRSAQMTRPTSRRPIQIVRYVLDSSVLPLVTDTLPVAEAARRALLALHRRFSDGAHSPVFSGKTPNGEPLQGHPHAYFLPADEDADGRLDHLTVVALGGFTAQELHALDALKELKTGRDAETRHPLQVVLIGLGTLEEFQARPVARAREWISATPYIATRYAKTRGRSAIDLRDPEQRIAFLIDDLRRQIEAATHFAGLAQHAATVQIEPLVDENRVFRIGGRWRPIQFKRSRAKSEDDGSRRLAGAFKLTFAEQVRGPIVLGHSAHFGMGLFMPAQDIE